MKIVDRKTFLACPPGTVYARYEPCIFGALEIKGENCGDDDWFYQELVGSIYCDNSTDFAMKLEDAIEKGESFKMDFDIESRDGCYNEDEIFAVWEDDDVRQLESRLAEARRLVYSTYPTGR